MVNIRQLVEFAVLNEAVGFIIAHNHPGGFAVPSADDYDTTDKLFKALNQVGVKLIDHFVIAEDDYTSMADSGYICHLEKGAGYARI